MTVKEVAQLTGLTHQAIYKRLKAHGVRIDTIKNRTTGQLTEDGEAIIRELFGISPAVSPATEETDTPAEEKPVEKPVANDVAELRNQVAELQNEVEKLRNQVATLENERDFLRLTLEREQQLHGLTISKLPTPPPALPPAEPEPAKRLSWWQRVRGKGKE